MLTRYKELYNRLTNSTAFKQEGSMDNSKINKNNWTPHNLKTILLGANGAICVYYTTNNTTPRLLETIKFTQGYKSEQEYFEGLKENKGMIDALNSGLKFNYLEEILFFNQGFQSEEERFKEFERVQAFISNPEIPKSFKRLQGVMLVDAPFTADLLDLNPKKSIVVQLKGRPMQPLVVYTPERTDLGLLVNQGLDSSEYKLDTKYEENADKAALDNGKIECRLSRYFYEEKQASLKQKAKEAEVKAKPEVKAGGEKEMPKYDYQLINAVDTTITRLERLYAPLWNGAYVGIIHKEGVAFKKATTDPMKSITTAIYSAWSTIALNGKDSESIETTSVKETGYIPGLHKGFLSNRQSWEKAKPQLKEHLLKKYALYFEKEENKITDYARGLTNCLIIKSRSKNQIILRMTGIEASDLDAFKKLFTEKVEKTYLANSSKGLIADMTLESGILTLTYIIDYASFLDEVLFAYKQYNEGITPSLSNALVGLKMDGTPLTVNLIDPRKMLTTIIAGSRSGKGTMTMGLLASLFGAGGSIIYLDNKPDIGAMLWDLEREYADRGLKLLSLDMGSEMQEFSGAAPIRTGSMNLLDIDADESDLFKTLRLAKLFQLISFIGSNSSKIERELGINAKNLFFIVDELTSTNIDYTKLGQYVEDMQKKYGIRAMKAKATEEDKSLLSYYSKLNNILSKAPYNLTKGFAKDFGQSGLKMIAIGQQLNSGWKVAGTNFSKSFAGKIIANSHTTFAGRLQANETTYSFNKEQLSLADKSGVFVLADKAPTPSDDSGASALGLSKEVAKRFTQFRSYFSLVKNDFNFEEYQAEGIESYLVNHGNRFTSQFLSNYSQKSESTLSKIINELYDFESGCNREEVSFSGLIKIMQAKMGMDDTTLVSNMNKGYTLVDAVFQKMSLGNYSCVEEYLCDCSPDSLYTQDELANKFDGTISTETVGTIPTKTVGTIPTKTVGTDDDEEIKLFCEEDIEDEAEGIDNKEYSPSSNQASAHPVSPSQTNGQPQGSQPTRPPAQSASQTQSPIKQAYTGSLTVENNPFDFYNPKSIGSYLVAWRKMTKIINEDIQAKIGPAHLVRSFRITTDGVLIFNNIAYQPTFDMSFLKTLPLTLRVQVESGQLAALFNLETVRSFKNLTDFVVEDNGLDRRIRQEVGVGFRKRYSILFKKFKSLNHIKVGEIEYTRENSDSQLEQKLLAKFKLDPTSTYSQGDGLIDKVWDSKPVRILAGAFGWVVGCKTVLIAASLFGPWGLLFGALAMAGTYNELKGNNENKKGNKGRGKKK